ncbi:phage tail tape measure protein [Rhizobium sp. S163]|uniref:phage tail tape measure protein n=1 Tax=Rhizobium sp. S163 TaxID=3055039 RepID=UPI0025A9B562|nr:phage tail tape measure protein [Rhizobium sp. S163]MDM9647764.1 phage tail tape measure protein [Rhizobium sp. S163]
MSDINVALRLRLKNDLSKEAPRAERDLKKVKQAADALGRAGGSNKLGKELGDVRREAGRSEKAVRNLDREARKLNNVNTNAAEREMKALGTAAKTAQRDVRNLERDARRMRGVDPAKMERLQKPAGALNTTMGKLTSSAGNAFGALLAFASVDSIVRGMERLSDQARKLDRDVASVAVTAEMRTPEAIERIGKSNSKLSVRYGIEQPQVNEARKTFAAAGFGLDQQEAILDPTLKSVKAGDSTGSTMAAAVIASQQALGVKNEEVPAALDMMAKGAKLGSFEVDAMAKNFPALATMYGGTGRSGLDGWAELIAAAQVVRMGAGSQDTAATNLENIIAKLSSPDTVKNFKEKGVDLERLKKKSIKNGTPYMMDVVDKVMQISKGNEFVIGELFGDMQAKQALSPLINNRDTYNSFLKQIKDDSRGTVDSDYDFLQDTSQERADRRGAALSDTGDKAGRTWDKLSSPLKEFVVRNYLNRDYGAQEYSREERQRLKGVDLNDIRSQIGDREKQLSNIPQSKFDVDLFAAQRQTITQEIDRLRGELKAASSVQGVGGGVEQNLGKDMSGAAQSSMEGYNSTLSAEGDKAVGIARDKAAAIRDSLNFTATPTIAPNFIPPTPAARPQALPKDEHSSLMMPSSSVKVANYFPGGNARLAAMRAQREQNRSIRMATARSLSDTGGKLA